jgi:Fe-Mn family superoxide dismutase
MQFLHRFQIKPRRIFRLMLPAIAAFTLWFTFSIGTHPAMVSAHSIPTAIAAVGTAPFQVPPLPYAYDALAPYIDAQTMHLHHDKHHQTYVTNLNGAIEKHPELRNTTAEDLIRHLNRIPDDIRTIVRNNAGGHLNHSLFWESMAPNHGGIPTGEIASAINQTFGSFDTFKQQFSETGTKLFGSGWAWLVLTRNGRLQIISTPNQDSPLLQGYYPLLGNDVWEHAYYLTYQNRRADYLNAWWNVVNWDEVNKRFIQARQHS